jgi:hypothetical protein
MTDEIDFFDVQPDKTVADQAKKDEPIKEVASIIQNSNLLSIIAKQAGCQVSTPEQLKILDDFMDSTRFGHTASLPMKCQGGSCPFLNICPLNRANMELPVGKSCPVEQAIMAQWVSNTMNALGINPNNPEDSVDINMVFELAGMELIRYRSAWHLSISPELVEERIVGYSPQGDPIYDEKPKMPLLIMEKYAKVIGKLRDQLLATRRSQAQVGKISGDLSVRAANMQAKAREIAEKRRGKVQDADFKVKDGPPA